MVRQVREFHGLGDLPALVKQRLGQRAIAEAAAQAGRFAVTGNHALQPLGGDVAGNLLLHFDKDKTAVAAVFFVQLQNGVAGSAAAAK